MRPPISTIGPICSVSNYPLDTMNKTDGLELLRSTPNDYTKLVIFDDRSNHRTGRCGDGSSRRFVLGHARRTRLRPTVPWW
jgi:hypothetical protein